MDPVRHARDRLPPRRHDDRPDHRAAAADLRQRPGGLERPGQQRDVRDADRDRRCATPGINRNGNLQITQFYYGAAQPSSAAAQIAGALFYGSAQDNGGPVSDPSVISNGNISWSGPWRRRHRRGHRPAGRGHGLPVLLAVLRRQRFDYIQTSSRSTAGRPAPSACSRPATACPTPDPQWPFLGGANFAVNPVNGNDVVISSSAGRIFATTNQGVTWFDIGDPAVFGSPGSFSVALAYGAPDPNAPEGIGNLGNFIYVGTQTGQIFVTQDGGGSGTSNNWINISTGPGRLGRPVDHHRPHPRQPRRLRRHHQRRLLHRRLDPLGHESHRRPWVNITGNLQNLAYTIFGQSYNPTTDPNAIKLVHQAVSSDLDRGRLALHHPQQSAPTPVAGIPPGAVRRRAIRACTMSLDNGKTWTLFPDTTFGAVAAGGLSAPCQRHRPRACRWATSTPDTGMPNLAGPYDPNNPTATPDPDLLLATTYGQARSPSTWRR